MRKFVTTLLIILLLFLIGCQISDNPTKTIDYIQNLLEVTFHDSCKYNLFLYKDVGIENIGIPLFIEVEDLGQMAVDNYSSFEYKGDNLQGLNIALDDILYKWTYENPKSSEHMIHVKTYNMSIKTNKKYQFSNLVRKINEVTLRIYNYEYIIMNI